MARCLHFGVVWPEPCCMTCGHEARSTYTLTEFLMRTGRAGCLFFVIASLATGAEAETVFSKSYSYFKVGGHTASELDAELSRRGPQMQNTGLRHPGATRMEFSGSVTYEGDDRRCRIKGAKIKLHTRIILPRWTGARKADRDLKIIWQTLSRDIKRHEERHAEIARQYARKLEQAILDLRPRRNCAAMQEAADAESDKVLARHDKAQAAFDRTEAASFDRRMSRMLKYRIDALNGR